MSQIMYERALSHEMAQNCEDAEGDECKCRCLGRLHGVSHKKYIEMEAAVLEEQKGLSLKDAEEIVDFILKTR